MSKLNRRQIIILFVMVVAVFYGAYELLIAPRTKQDVVDIGKKSVELDTFINEISTYIPKGSHATSDSYMIKRAESHWMRDPFYERKSYREWVKVKEPAKAGSGAQKVIFDYSGYVNIKDKKIAVINGVEYESGDTLEIEGYILKGIYQNKVVIENMKSRSQFDVLLQE